MAAPDPNSAALDALVRAAVGTYAHAEHGGAAGDAGAAGGRLGAWEHALAAANTSGVAVHLGPAAVCAVLGEGNGTLEGAPAGSEQRVSEWLSGGDKPYSDWLERNGGRGGDPTEEDISGTRKVPEPSSYRSPSRAP